jgi:hypothetical protein
MSSAERLTIAKVDAALRLAAGAQSGCAGNGCRCAGVPAAGDARLAARLLPLVAELDVRLQQVLKQRYGLSGESPQTLQAIGDKLNRTRERVRQIQNAALGKLLVLAQANERG